MNKYNKNFYKRIKVKSVDLKSSTYIEFNKENNKEDPNLKSVIKLEYKI